MTSGPFGGGARSKRVRRPARLIAVGFFASSILVGATTGTALAATPKSASQFKSSANGVAVAVGIDSAKITSNGGAGGNCTWLVDTTVTVANLTKNVVSVANENDNEGRVVWSDPSTSGVVTPHVTMTWPNSSSGYGIVRAHSSIDGTATATFTMPCSATDGDLGIDFHVFQGVYPNLGQETTLSGDAPFLVNGTQVPVIAGIGGALFAGAVGGLLLLRVRRRSAATAS